MRDSERTGRRTRPGVEGLEGRLLLHGSSGFVTPSGQKVADNDLLRYLVQKANNVPLSDRHLLYTTPEGTQVDLTLYGFGTLAGSSVGPDGALDLVYNNTTATSRIVARVHGGSGHAFLRSLRDADVPARSPVATGSEPLAAVTMPHFRLVEGGYVNLGGGVGSLFLDAAGPNTEIHLKPLPTSTSSSSSTSGSTGTTVTGSGGTGATVFTSTGTSSTTTTPPGAVVTIPHVTAGPLPTPLGNAQVVAFDPATGRPTRFDAVTGAATAAFPAVPTATPARVGLGRAAGRQLVLVGDGGQVAAFDATSGAPVGSFSTGALGRVDGIAGAANTTVLVRAGGPAVPINVAASLASGRAVAAGPAFVPTREFTFTGGASGVAGSDTIYALGAAHFDPAQPDRLQYGVMAINTAGGVLRETARTALPGLGGGFIDAGPVGGPLRPEPAAGLGALDADLAALVVVPATGARVLTRLNPATLAPVGVATLAGTGPLSGLSESFHPELRGAALIDVQGDLRRFVGNDARGLVLNVNGALNLVDIHSAADTAVVGRPLNHVEIPRRSNVRLVSTARGTTGTDTRGGVVIQAMPRPLGPLTLP